MKTRTLVKWTLLVAAVAVVGAGLVASGHQRGLQRTAVERPGQAGLTMRGLDSVLDELEATEEQRAQLQTLIDEWNPVVTELADGAQRARKLLREQFEAEQPDTASLHAVVDEQAGAVRRAGHGLIDDIVALHATLTAEQREAVNAHWAQDADDDRAPWGGRRWR